MVQPENPSLPHRPVDRPVPDAHQLTFHVIFLPGTAAYLLPMVSTLVNWSPARFSLVANGIDETERRELQEFTDSHERTQFIDMTSTKVLEHGQVLDLLQEACEGPFFCALDPDIFAVGPFLDGLVGQLRDAAAVFSGRPIYAREEDLMERRTHGFLASGHVFTMSGDISGCTWVMLYDNDQVSAARTQSGVGFRRYLWGEIPEQARRLLFDTGWKRDRYDTGKVLNLMIKASGGELRYLDSQSLRHIGGLCTLLSQQSGAEVPLSRGWELWKRRIASRLAPAEVVSASRLSKRRRAVLMGAEALAREFTTGGNDGREPSRGPTRLPSELESELRDVFLMNREGRSPR